MPGLALNRMKSDLVAMGEMCEYALSTAIMSLIERDEDLALHIVEYDQDIDEMELKVDRECCTLLQSGKLIPEDIRFVMAASKINNDLERIGDQAAHICEHVLFLVREKSILAQIVDFVAMLEQVSEMIRESINALLERDAKLAWKIIDERKIVQEETVLVFHELTEIMKQDPRTIIRCCHILFIVQSLHRVADQAANIAEEVIFTEEGVVIRHHLSEFHPVDPVFDLNDMDEATRTETRLLEKRRPRDEIRRAHDETRKTRTIPKEARQAQAKSGETKAHQAREKLLRLRAAARNSKHNPGNPQA